MNQNLWILYDIAYFSIIKILYYCILLRFSRDVIRIIKIDCVGVMNVIAPCGRNECLNQALYKRIFYNKSLWIL